MGNTLVSPAVARDLRFVKLISEGEDVVIGPTKGQYTIANATNTFKAGIDFDFVKYRTKVKGEPTKKMKVQVFDQTYDATPGEIFAGFGKNPEDLCLSQDQIIYFVENHHKWFPHTTRWGILFLFKVGKQFFIASVNRKSDGSYVYLFRYHTSRNLMKANWGQRIVVPKL